IQPEAADDDLLLPRIQVMEDRANLQFALTLLGDLRIPIRSLVRLRQKDFFSRRAESIPMLEFFRNRPSKVLDDRPTCIGAKFVPTRVVEFLTSPNQGHVAVADQLEEIFLGLEMSLGNRD